MDLFEFDLDSAAENGAEMFIHNPVTGEKTDASITLKGADSHTFRNAAMEIAEGDLGRDEYIDRMADLLAAVTVGWKGIEWDGKPLKFSQKEAKRIYIERAWLRNDIDAFISERSNFFAAA